MPRALLSVSDKTGLMPFARALRDRGWSLLSTGGTARALREDGLDVTDVSEVTGHPEIMDGRVKTLHPAVHAGLLGRARHAGDAREMGDLGYEPIDMVVVNLYPFQQTVAREGVSDAEAIDFTPAPPATVEQKNGHAELHRELGLELVARTVVDKRVRQVVVGADPDPLHVGSADAALIDEAKHLGHAGMGERS